MKNFFTVFVVLSVLLPVSLVHAATATSILSMNQENVIQIVCGPDSAPADDYSDYTLGTGVVLSNEVVLTSATVVTMSDGLTYQDWCVGSIIESGENDFSLTFALVPYGIGRADEYFNYAFMTAVDLYTGETLDLGYGIEAANADAVEVYDDYTVLGFEDGGDELTYVNGEIDGFAGSNLMMTDTDISWEYDGSGAFDRDGNMLGLVVSFEDDNGQLITYIQNLNAILEDAWGASIAVRDYATLHSDDNWFCIQDYCYNASSAEVDWSEIVEDNDAAADEPAEDDAVADDSTDDALTVLTYTVPDHAAYDAAKADASLLSRLNGYILLQVEQHGEAWYVHPTEHTRYYMRDGAIAYQMMRSFGLGITDADLAGVPSVDAPADMLTKTSVCSSNSLANRLKGQILLQVEQHGEAWYVHPEKCYRVYIKDGDTAYETLRYLSLGITDADLATLPYSSTMVFK